MLGKKFVKVRIRDVASPPVVVTEKWRKPPRTEISLLVSLVKRYP
jgi:hypothetical protein